jgi:hypothetical protein
MKSFYEMMAKTSINDFFYENMSKKPRTVYWVRGFLLFLFLFKYTLFHKVNEGTLIFITIISN